MDKHRFFLALFFLFLNAFLFAQKGRIQGQVMDQLSKEPIPFASVQLKSADLQRGIITDVEGGFLFEKLPFGTYEMVVSYIGFSSHKTAPIILSKTNTFQHLPEIELFVDTHVLEEINITASTHTQKTKIDRKSYSSSDFYTAQGGNAADLLNKIPSVSVDTDGQVSVRGTTDFMVYLNGKPTNLNPSVLLGQIASSTIDKIDIISVPTARYDAQGKGGIINITTKKNTTERFSLFASGLLGGAPWANHTDTYSGHYLKDDRHRAGFQASFHRDNLTLSGGMNHNRKNVNGMRSGQARVFVDDPKGDFFHMNATDGQRPEWYENFTANAALDYRVSNRQTFSLSYFYGKRNEGRAAYYVYHNFFAAADGSQKDSDTEKFMYNPNKDNRYGTYHTANAGYKILCSDGATLKIATAYEASELSRSLTNTNYTYATREEVDAAIKNAYDDADPRDAYSLSDQTPLEGVRFSVDYEKESKKDHFFGAGLQVQYTGIQGDFTFDNDKVSKDLNNGINLNRTIYAAYIDYAAAKGKTSYILGLRSEYGDQSMDIQNTDYVPLFGTDLKPSYVQRKLDLFPSVHLSHQIDEKNSIILAGSRRINRASVTKLAPFLYRRHFEVYVVGDPELEAEYINNLEITYDASLGKHRFGFTGFYRGTDNTVFRVNTVTTAIENEEINTILEEDVLIRSYTNAGNATSLGAELNADFFVSSRVKLFLGTSLYAYQIKGDVFGYYVDQNSTNWSVKANANFSFSKKTKLNLDFNRRSATVTSQGANDAFSATNIALNHQTSSAWNFSLRALDVFSQNNTGLDTNAFNRDGDQIFYQETQYLRNGPVFELGVSYAFNAKKKKKSKDFQANKHFK